MQTKDVTESVNIFKKIIMFFLLIIIGIIAGGIYGFIHDQITYTVSLEYYTKFKFNQFNIIHFQNRFGAGIVGIKATWWMGLILSVILGIIGFIHKDYKKMFKSTLQSFLFTTIIALITGIIGLFAGYLMFKSKGLSYFKYWFLPENLKYPLNFIMVGMMHNFSYLGGGIGLLGGIIWQIISRIKSN